ncbi:YigZ family protein [Anoxynatronum sibiricum]|uniref:YigZ family protein n=1 Tax=Anoxynatronum sibiricum TaxID=210623 RepID=A0ABU9VY45_9CLOT
MNKYNTVARQCVKTLEIEKSSFVGIAFPLKSEEEVAEFLKNAHMDYPGANHYAYAYVFGVNRQIQKFSDDGEPSGTAGLPILELLKHRSLDNTMVIVLRYFGGIKLGTGGLKRAYSHTAIEAIQAAGIITLTRCSVYAISCPYHYWGKVQYELESKDVLIDEVKYSETVKLKLVIPLDYEKEALKRLDDISSSQILKTQISTTYRYIKSLKD